jgi:hypothetical protein
MRRVLLSLLISSLAMSFFYFCNKAASKEEGDYMLFSIAGIFCTTASFFGAVLLLLLFAIKRYFNPFLSVFIPIFIIYNLFAIYLFAGFFDFSDYIKSDYVIDNLIGLLIMIGLHLFYWLYRRKKSAEKMGPPSA